MNKSTSSLEKMRPVDDHEKALFLRAKCGQDFYNTHNKNFIEVNCPACGNIGESHFRKYGFSHRHCDSCSTVWCSPRPTDELLSLYYMESEATKFWTSLLIKTNSERKAIQYAPRVKKLVEFIKNDSSVLPTNNQLAVDLGAGSGAFALALKNTNFYDKVIAVDFDDDCCIACEEIGLNTIKGSVDSLDNTTVDLITMNDIIEHLFDPASFLNKIHTKLSTNGIISIACPNGVGFDFQLMKDKTVNITPPEHLNYFTPSSLSLLLEKSGFKTLSTETPGILDVQIVERAFKNNELELDDNQFLKNILEDNNPLVLDNLQDFIRKSKVSSHMVVTAQKICN